MSVAEFKGRFICCPGKKYQIKLPSGFEFTGKFLTVVSDAREYQYWVAVFELEAVDDFNVTVGIHEKIIFNPDFSISLPAQGGVA